MDRSGPSRGRSSANRPPNRPPNGPPKPNPGQATGRTAEKRKLLTNKEKAEIIKLVDQGKGIEEVAKRFNTTVSCVEHTLKNRDEILKDVAKGGGLSSFKIKKKKPDDESNNSPLALAYGPTPGMSYGYDGGAGPSRRYGDSAAGSSRYSNPVKVESGGVSSYGFGEAFRNNSGFGEAFRNNGAAKSERDARPSQRFPPVHGDSRRGTLREASGSRATVTETKFKANYFVLKTQSRWVLYKHHVSFEPNEERRNARHHLMRFHKDKFSGYQFDGSTLYTVSEACPENQSIELVSENREGQRFTITVKNAGVCSPEDEQYMQVFNIILRNCLRQLNLQEVRRKYCDPAQSRDVPNTPLKVWPGYETAIAQYQYNVLLKTEIAFAVLRKETALDIWLQCVRNRECNPKDAFKNAMLGTHVLTTYNNKSYRIDDVDFTLNPRKTFTIKKRGEETEISFIQYFQQRYNGTVIRDHNQPMLISKANRRQRRAGLPELMVLVPELCATTGISDSERSNFQVMKQFSETVKLNPSQRVQRLKEFAQRLNVPKVVETLKFWNFELQPELVDVPGRTLKPEEVTFGGGIRESATQQAEWQMAFRKQKLYRVAELKQWILVYPQKMDQTAREFCRELCTVGAPMGMQIPQPFTYPLQDDRTTSYLQAINKGMNESNPGLVVTILTNNKSDRYGEIKRLCILERPIPSQVVVSRTIVPDKRLKSVCTKIAIQINCKLGGAPWFVDIRMEVRGLMIVGFDVTHDPSDKCKSYGAMVATYEESCSRYFSILEHHPNGEELSTAFGHNLMKAVENFKSKNNGAIPNSIVIFRDGVGEGNVQYVKDQEVNQAKSSLAQYYAASGTKLKMSFIIVTKKHNTRIFATDPRQRQECNPPPGSIVDDVITMPHRREFYLISQSVRQGTVSPTHYNVIENSTGWEIEKLQQLTYKMTHMYFNWSGTVKVPAPCQYAHKLAFLTSNHLRRSPQPSENRDSLLYYL